MTEVSIIMGARGRADSTRRTLQSYTKLSYKDYELLFMDIQHNGDDLGIVYDEFKDKLPIRRIPIQEYWEKHTPETTWTPATTWNYGFRYVTGKFIIICGADIILSYPDMIERFLAQYKDRRNSVLTYFLSKSMLDALDSVDWMGNPDSIQTLNGFWESDTNGNLNKNRTQAGHTTYITGQPLDDWKWWGLFRTELSHLVNDQDLVMREVYMDKFAGTLEGYCGYHQAHPIEKEVPGINIAKISSPGWNYHSEAQARLLEPASRDAQ